MYGARLPIFWLTTFVLKVLDPFLNGLITLSSSICLKEIYFLLISFTLIYNLSYLLTNIMLTHIIVAHYYLTLLCLNMIKILFFYYKFIITLYLVILQKILIIYLVKLNYSKKQLNPYPFYLYLYILALSEISSPALLLSFLRNAKNILVQSKSGKAKLTTLFFRFKVYIANCYTLYIYIQRGIYI